MWASLCSELTSSVLYQSTRMCSSIAHTIHTHLIIIMLIIQIHA